MVPATAPRVKMSLFLMVFDLSLWRVSTAIRPRRLLRIAGAIDSCDRTRAGRALAVAWPRDRITERADRGSAAEPCSRLVSRARRRRPASGPGRPESPVASGVARRVGAARRAGGRGYRSVRGERRLVRGG